MIQLLSSFVSKSIGPNIARKFPSSANIAINALPSDFVDTSFLTNAVNAWSVNGATLTSTDIAADLFAFSLFPYLILLFFLARPVVNTPKLGNFGFQFLLAFVFATIPAGIYAKVQYHDILANVDWLHGLAESLLTVTNVLIIAGFRKVRPEPPKTIESKDVQLLDAAIPLLLGMSILTSFLTSFPHTEPANALSLPTWLVHTSSLIEWLAAMKLIWEHADVSGNPRWKGMTFAMIPSHVRISVICNALNNLTLIITIIDIRIDSVHISYIL
jgi:hypothetical protein